MPTFEGTNGPDSIIRPVGSNSQDTIIGLGGNDTLDGAERADLIEGGQGADSIIGGSGTDLLRGGSGNDAIDAGTENDTVDGGSNNDSILAGEGNNIVYGGSGDDTITAGSGGDLIYGDKDPTDTLPGGEYDYRAYLYNTNFSDWGPNVGHHYGTNSFAATPGVYDLAGINTTGAPITVTLKDDDAFLRTDGLGGNNDVFNEPNQIVVINGVEYPVLLEQIVTYQDASGTQYRFLQLDYDLNRNGSAGPADLQEQGSLQVLISSPPPPVGARLQVVSGSVDTTSDFEYENSYNDLITSGAGGDTIYGQQGNDTIDAGDGADVVDGGSGNDSISGGGAADNLTGGEGNDLLDGGSGDDLLTGSAGNDTLRGGDGQDIMNGGDGADSLEGAAGRDQMDGGAGNDTLSGGGDDDILTGAAGDDSLEGGDGSDQLTGGTGNDSLNGGAGSDALSGGSGNDQIIAGLDDQTSGNDDRDTFTLSAADGGTGLFLVNGGTGSTAAGDVDDYDSLVLGPGLSFVGGSMQRTVDEATGPGMSYSGSFRVTDGTNTYTVRFQEIENLVVCFVRGSLIETMSGLRPVEALRAGDLIRTRDHGFKPISWIGSQIIANDHSPQMQKIGPIRVSAGALGAGLPARDLYLSPQHRVLVRSRIARRMFGADEVLVAVKHLLELPGVEAVADFTEVEYFHILFDQHEIVYANGLEAESLHTGPQALRSLTAEALEEIFTIFPNLADPTPDARSVVARPSPQGRLARQLAHRHVKNGIPLQ
jgi:Ca2+-binding RTX toxin-like protein